MTRIAPRISRLLSLLLLVPLLTSAFAFGPPAQMASALEAGFQDSSVVNVASPTALAFAPDGRMLITTQPGRLYVYTTGAPVVALDLTVGGLLCDTFERGLLA